MFLIPFLFVLASAAVHPGFDDSAYDPDCVAKIEKTVSTNQGTLAMLADRIGKIEDNCAKVKK